MCIKGKRLLVLGGSNNAKDIRAFADKEKIKIIVAGLYFSREIEKIADEKYYVDIYDKKQIISVVQEHEIDGIFVGGNEDIISRVIDVTNELCLPFYSSRELWDTLMNKAQFKEACRQYGVPTVEDVYVDENDLDKTADSLPYPVVVKPVDNSGSTGVMKCDSANSFKELYGFAKSNSKAGRVTVEKYSDGFEICVYYTFVDGIVTMSSMSDKYVRGDENTFFPLSEIYAYPSQYIEQYIEQVDQNMRRMLLGLGIKNGITSMQGFYRDGGFEFFEMGYRLGGTAQYRYTDAINGVNSLHMMMAHALTGKMPGERQAFDNAMFNKPCCTLTLLSKGGTVASIEGLEEAEKIEEVIHIENRYGIGDTIPVSRTTTQFHIRIFIIADNLERMRYLVNYLQTSIKAYDIKGESMLITHFDTDKLTFGGSKFSINN